MARATRTAPSIATIPRSHDAVCVLLILLATLGVYAPSLFGGKVLLPADIVPIMRPWMIQGKGKLTTPHHALNQLHGPIFEYYSWRHQSRERIRGGEIPLWNPYELGGNVLLANSQSAVLYPPNVLLYLFTLPTGINLVTALHTFLTGFFLYGLMRALRLRPLAALTSALVWMFCGVQMAWLEFQTPTAALCWLPGLLWAWEGSRQTECPRPALIGGAVGVALALLAGHLHFAFYVLLAFAVYALARTIIPALFGRRFGEFGRGLGLLVGAFGIGMALSACTLAPVVEMARMNFRAGKTDYASSIGLKMPPVNLFTLVQPNIFGSPRDYLILDEKGNRFAGYAYWGAFDYIEFAFYLGIPGLVLGLVGASAAFKRRGRSEDDTALDRFAPRFGVGMSALGLLLALGTPICALFFYLVPGYGQFNATGRAICLFCFGMAALAGTGVEMLAANGDNGRSARRYAVALTAVVVVGIVAFPGLGLIYRKMLDDHWLAYESEGLRHFVVVVALMALVGWIQFRKAKSDRGGSRVLYLLPFLAAVDLLAVYARFNPQEDPWMLGYPTDTTDFLQRAYPDRVVSLEDPDKGTKSFIVPNYNAVVGLREAQGADSLHTRRYHQLMEKVVRAMEPERGAAFPDPNTIHVPTLKHPIFDMLNVRYATTLPEKPSPDPSRYQFVLSAELTIWENTRAMGPAWIVGRAERADGLEAFLAKLADPAFDAKATALVGFDPPPLDPEAGESSVKMAAFSPHRIALDIQSRGRGLLVVSEIAFPGWHATMDGAIAPILTANHILRAIPVSPGAHHVEMVYRPVSYLVGLYLTCIATGLSGALVLTLRTGRRIPTIRGAVQ